MVKSETEPSTKMDKNIHHLFSAVKNEFDQVREELDEHLAAINENSEEISANYEYLMEVDRKVDMLAARMDQLQMMVRDLLLSQIEVTNTDDGKTVKLSAFY